MNIFDSDSPHIDIQERERLATRIYITFLILISITLFIYLIFTENARPITVVQPPLSVVVRLQKEHPLSLSCPCSQPSTLHSSLFIAEVIFCL